MSLPLARAAGHQPGGLPNMSPPKQSWYRGASRAGLEQGLSPSTLLPWLTGILPVASAGGARAAASHTTDNQPRSAGTSSVGSAVMESTAGKGCDAMRVGWGPGGVLLN